MDADADAARRPDETEAERLDRNFADLLQEVRVAQTGVQILFAFLLTLPFAARFEAIDGRGRVVYVITLLAAAAAAAFLIAPVTYHRLVFRQGRKAELVHTASVLAQLGVAFLLLAIVGAVFVVGDEVMGPGIAALMSGGVCLLCLSLWYLLPMVRGTRS